MVGGRDYNVGAGPGTPIQSVFNQTLSKRGPLVLPQFYDFTSETSIAVDLSPLIMNGNIDFISGAYIDNADSTELLTISIDGLKQRIIIPAGHQAYMPMLAPNNPKFVLSYASSPGIILNIDFYNIPLLPYMWSGTGAGGVIVDWAGYPGLTDAELRNSPVSVAVSGQGVTNRSIANLAGSSETLMAANASRRFLFIQNIASNNMGVNFVGGSAAIGTAGTITLLPGASITFDNNAPTGAITIIGTANDDVTAMEG